MRWGVLATAAALVVVGVVLALTDLASLGAPFDVEARMFGLVVGIGGIGLAVYALFARGAPRPPGPALGAPSSPPEPPLG